jgi:hypothetical protein
VSNGGTVPAVSSSWAQRFARVRAASIASPSGEISAILVLCPILLAVALWNGFPIIFYDTGAYILEGLGHVFVPERAPVYSLLLSYTDASSSLWYVAWLQAAISAFVIVELARCEAAEMPVWKLAAIGAALVLFTGVGWYVGQIEPDCMTAVLVISIYLLSFRSASLSPLRVALLVLVAALAEASHPAHLVLVGALILFVMLVRLVAWHSRRLTLPKPKVVSSLASLALAIALVLSANYNLTHHWFISRSGPVFVFARMLQDGLVGRVLSDTCPQSHYVLCAFRNRLPNRADAWLWDDTSPFNKLNRFHGPVDEYERIVFDSLARYPLLNAAAAIKDTAVQFVEFRTGDQIEAQEWVLYSDLAHYLPRQMNAYMRARQQRGELEFAMLNRIHVSVAAAALLALLLSLSVAVARLDWRGGTLPAFVLVALFANAFICGALSNPHDRYQSRLVWVPVLVIALSRQRLPAFSLRKAIESGT